MTGENGDDHVQPEPTEADTEPGPDPAWVTHDPVLREVLASAALLQGHVPDAVLVGGSVAALYAGHRASYDHDHVLPHLKDTYAAVLDAVEACPGWVTNTRISKPPLTIMGSIEDIEAGLRQLRRTVPLETAVVNLPDDKGRLVIPTMVEALRIKAYLIVQRNQVRDYLDVAALSNELGIPTAAEVLLEMDDYYTDRSRDVDAVTTAVVERLASPSPRDRRVIDELPRYKGLAVTWHDWANVEAVCAHVAALMVEKGLDRWS